MSTTNTPTTIQPYLFFDGRCEEAVEFYRKAVGAEVAMLLRFKDNPEPPQPGCPPPSDLNKIMHGELRIGGSPVLVSDGECKGKPNFQGFALSLTVTSEAEAKTKYEALVAGGNVIMPLMKTFFSPSFGMVNDKFGVCWMVYMVGKK